VAERHPAPRIDCLETGSTHRSGDGDQQAEPVPRNRSAPASRAKLWRELDHNFAPINHHLAEALDFPQSLRRKSTAATTSVFQKVVKKSETQGVVSPAQRESIHDSRKVFAQVERKRLWR
jgi:hypothetical protein